MQHFSLPFYAKFTHVSVGRLTSVYSCLFLRRKALRPSIRTIALVSGGYIRIGGMFLGSKAAAMKVFTDAGLFKAIGQPASNVRNPFVRCTHLPNQ